MFFRLEKGHKKAREEEMRAIKSKVMSLPSTPAHPTLVIFFSLSPRFMDCIVGKLSLKKKFVVYSCVNKPLPLPSWFKSSCLKPKIFERKKWKMASFGNWLLFSNAWISKKRQSMARNISNWNPLSWYWIKWHAN